jgi:hypothetical protein
MFTERPTVDRARIHWFLNLMEDVKGSVHDVDAGNLAQFRRTHGKPGIGVGDIVWFISSNGVPKCLGVIYLQDHHRSPATAKPVARGELQWVGGKPDPVGGEVMFLDDGADLEMNLVIKSATDGRWYGAATGRLV